MVKFPEVIVQLSDEDGNAFFIMGRTRRAMRDAGIPRDAIDEFSSEAMSGDYDHVLQTVMATVTTE